MNTEVSGTGVGTAATPTATQSQVGQSGSDDYGFLSESGEVVSTGQEATQSEPGYEFLDESGELAKGQATDKQTAQTKPEPQKSAIPPGVKKRIDTLTAKRREAEKRIIELEAENQRIKTAYDLRDQIAKAKEARLQEIEPQDERETKIQQLELERTLAKKQAELEQAYRKRVQDAKNAAQTEALVERWSEEVEEALAQFPDVSNAELVLTFKQEYEKNPKIRILDIAKQIDERRFSGYEKRVLQKYGPRLTPPQPTAQNSHIVQRQINTDQDLVDELDAMLGPDWNSKKPHWDYQKKRQQ